MKRSEAVEEIRKILAMNGKDNGEGELEEAILHHLESLGMYPPPALISHTEVLSKFNKGQQIPGDMVNLREAVIRLMFEVKNG